LKKNLRILAVSSLSAPAAYPSSFADRPKRVNATPYLFTSPFFILFTLFFLFPSVYALVLSLYNWNGVGEPEFIGLANYNRMFNDDVFWQAVSNTLIYAAASLFIVVPLALLLAVALNAKTLRLKTLWRTMYFTPVVTSSIAIILVFRILYNRETGLFNAPLIALGLDPIDWLGDTQYVKTALIILIGWRSLGLVSVYFLAGLQSISQDLYEAASIDGATPREQLLYITIPLLRPIILFVSILTLIGTFQIFEEPQILTGGGPGNASLTLVQYLYARGFTRLRLGFASSVGTVLFVAIFVLSLIQLRWFGAFRRD
jgi:ABC-type sugar transport system permease subunit